MKYYFIYKWTNIVTNEYYIGKHYGTTEDVYIGSGVLFLTKYKSSSKLDWERQVLFKSNSLDVINFLEYFLVNKNTLTCNLILNKVIGGKGGFSEECYRVKEEWEKTEEAKLLRFSHGKWLANSYGKAVFEREGFQSWAAKQQKGKRVNRYKGLSFTEEIKLKLYPKHTCPKCGLTGNSRAIKQWHGLDGEKCKRMSTE